MLGGRRSNRWQRSESKMGNHAFFFFTYQVGFRSALMQHLLIWLIYTVFQHYILDITAKLFERKKKKIMLFSTKSNNEVIMVLVFTFLLTTCCSLRLLLVRKKRTSTKIRCLINCTLNNTALINYPPRHPLYASLTGWGVVSSDDRDCSCCTSVGGQLDLQASLLTGTGTAVLAGCFPEASIDTQVLVWITGSQD